jgi:hypothetical protein
MRATFLEDFLELFPIVTGKPKKPVSHKQHAANCAHPAGSLALRPDARPLSAKRQTNPFWNPNRTKRKYFCGLPNEPNPPGQQGSFGLP